MQSKPVLTSAQQKWVDALRSGEYKQVRERLCTPEGYCCLGVACAIFKDELGLRTRVESGVVTFNLRASILPDSVKTHLNLYTSNGARRSGVGPSLVYENDENKLTFNQIADLIETGEYFAYAPTEEVG